MGSVEEPGFESTPVSDERVAVDERDQLVERLGTWRRLGQEIGCDVQQAYDVFGYPAGRFHVGVESIDDFAIAHPDGADFDDFVGPRVEPGRFDVDGGECG